MASPLNLAVVLKHLQSTAPLCFFFQMDYYKAIEDLIREREALSNQYHFDTENLRWDLEEHQLAIEDASFEWQQEETLAEGNLSESRRDEIAYRRQRIAEINAEWDRLQAEHDAADLAIWEKILALEQKIEFQKVLAELVYKKNHWARRGAAVRAWYARRLARSK